MAASPRVTARLAYASDEHVDGMWHACVVRAIVPHARITAIDHAGVPDGVVVMTADDLRDCEDGYGSYYRDTPILADATVRYTGEPVAAVAAPTLDLARRAADAIRVDYDERPGVFDVRSAAEPGGPLVHERLPRIAGDPSGTGSVRPVDGTNVCHRFRLRQGDVDAGLADADVVVSRTYRVAAAAHAAMEPHASLAWWDRDRLIVRTGTQTPHVMRADLAELFRLRPAQVRVEVARMGGSFGSKTFLRTEPIAAALARRAGHPVRLVLTREEEFVTLNRHAAVFEVTLGAARDGTLVASRIGAWWDTGAYADAGPSLVTKGGYAAIGPYRTPNVAVDSHCVWTNRPPAGAYRGYGATQGVWASERCMDALADALAMDPFDLRMRNLLQPGERFATGETIREAHFAECLRAAADAVDWHTDRTGKGLAVILKGMQTPSVANATLEIADDGIVLRSATTDMGQRNEAAQAALAAEALGIPASIVRVGPNTTDDTPFDTRTTSSRSTHMMATAIADAAGDLKAALADRLEAAVDDLVLGDGGAIGVRGSPDARWRLSDLAGTQGHGAYETPGGLDPDTGQGVASSEWHQSAAAAHVTVDRRTGAFTVAQLHAAVWAGRVVDRPGAELQTEGSMIMGLGTTMFEDLVFDGGQLTNANLSDYNIPSLGDIPAFTYELLERDGARPQGLGETALPVVPPAVGNALASLGAHVTDLPISFEAVAGALDDSGATS